MTTRFLFPHRYKRLGWALALVSLILGLLEMYNLLHLPRLLAWLPGIVGQPDWDSTTGRAVRDNHDLYAVAFVIGGLLAACSRERREDEYIGQIRLDALLWALYAYSALLVAAFVLVSGDAFFTVMTYAMFAPLLLFVGRFQFELFRGTRTLGHDE